MALNPVNESVCSVTTLQAPVDMTMKFVNYHLNTGIDHMFLFFSNPHDPALEALSCCTRTTCIRCDSRHWADHNLTSVSDLLERLKCNATIGFERARKSGFSWMIHMDVDELIFSREPIAAHLAVVSKRVESVRIAVFEAVPEKTDYSSIFEEIDLFKVMPTGLQKYRARLAAKGAFFRGEYFRGQSMGKSALRTNANFSGVWCHGPIVEGQKMLPAITLSEVKLLHFDSCTVEAWKNKWGRVCESGLLPTGLRKNRIRQFESFAVLYKEGALDKLEDLYRQFYHLSVREKRILSEMGLLRRIHLDGRLFSGVE